MSTRSVEELWSVPTLPAAEEAFMVSWRKRGSNGRRGGKDRRFLHGAGAQEGVLGGGAEDRVQEAGYGMLADSKVFAFSSIWTVGFGVSVVRETGKMMSLEELERFD